MRLVPTLWISLLLLLTGASPVWAGGVLALTGEPVSHPWNHGLEQGFKKGANEAGLFLPLSWRSFEAAEWTDPTSGPTLAALLGQSYKNNRPDLILVTDPATLEWATGDGAAFVQGTPLLVGLKTPLSPAALTGEERIGGMVSTPDLELQLKAALQLFPQTQEVYVVNDPSGPGALLKPLLTEPVAHFRNLTFLFLEGLDFERLGRELNQLPQDSLVLLGYSEALEQAQQLPALERPVPILPLFAYQIPWGALGGPVVSSFYLGKNLAAQAVPLLETKGGGTVQQKSLLTWIYNRHALKELGLERNQLQAQALFWGPEENNHRAWALSLSLFGCFVLGLATFYLGYYFWKKSQAERNLVHANRWLETQVNQSTDEMEHIYRRIQQELGERKGAEQALFASEQRFKAFVDHTPVGILVSDPQGQIEYANPALAAFFKIESDSLVDKPVTDFFPKDLVVFGNDTGTQEELQPREWALNLKGTKQVLLSKTAIFSGPEKERRAITFVVDITGIKRIETQLRRANEEARSAVKAKAEFLATMSHEIRTPLNSVLGMSNLLRDTHLDEDQQEYIEAITTSGENLLNILNGILDYSKIEAGRMEIHEGRVDPLNLMETVIEILNVQAEVKGLDLACQMDSEVPWSVLADETRLNQVLINLVGNAIKFTEQGSVQLVCRLDAAKTSLEFQVRDTGIGIPQEYQDNLFEAFKQVDGSLSRKYGGTGLGLAICKKLVLLMGGRIWMESEPKVGSNFSFTLPLKPFKRELKNFEKANDPAFLSKRLLWVSDDLNKTKVLLDPLEQWGLKVTVVNSRFWSPQLLKESVDLILVDRRLTDLSLKPFLAELKQAAPGPVLYLKGEKEAKKDPWSLPWPMRRSFLYGTLERALSGKLEENLGGKKAAYPELAKLYPMEILVADDNPLNLRLTSKMLERMGYVATTATDGEEAVQKVVEGAFQLVLMDIQMPRMDGIMATHQIWDQMGNHRPKILALTANAATEDLLSYAAQGFDGYLTKPLMPQTLVDTLQMWGQFFQKQALKTEPA